MFSCSEAINPALIPEHYKNPDGTFEQIQEKKVRKRAQISQEGGCLGVLSSFVASSLFIVLILSE